VKSKGILSANRTTGTTLLHLHLKFQHLHRTYPKKVLTSITSSDLEMTSLLNSTKQRRKFSYTSWWRNAFRTCNHSNQTCNHSNKTCN